MPKTTTKKTSLGKLCYSSFQTHPLYRSSDLPPSDSVLHPCTFVLSYHPDGAGESSFIYYDLVSKTEHVFGENIRGLALLQKLLRSVMPHLDDLCNARDDLDGIYSMRMKSKDKNSDLDPILKKQLFYCTWLSDRVSGAFDAACIQSTQATMNEVAKAHKPLTVESFVQDLSVNGNVVRLIEESNLTRDICKKAVAETATSLRFIPAKLITEELALLAFKKRFQAGGALKYVPVESRTKVVCEAAVISDFKNLSEAPEKTVDLCALACLSSGLAWDIVPKEMRSKEVELCAAFHGYSTRDVDDVFDEMLLTMGGEALPIASSLHRKFLQIHYPAASEDDLKDMGLYFDRKKEDSSQRHA